MGPSLRSREKSQTFQKIGNSRPRTISSVLLGSVGGRQGKIKLDGKIVGLLAREASVQRQSLHMLQRVFRLLWERVKRRPRGKHGMVGILGGRRELACSWSIERQRELYIGRKRENATRRRVYQSQFMPGGRASGMLGLTNSERKFEDLFLILWVSGVRIPLGKIIVIGSPGD